MTGVGRMRVVELRVASCELRVASCEWGVVSCQLRVAICQLRVASCELRVEVASCELRVASGELQVAMENSVDSSSVFSKLYIDDALGKSIISFLVLFEDGFFLSFFANFFLTFQVPLVLSVPFFFKYMLALLAI